MIMCYFFGGKTARDSDVASKSRQYCIQNTFEERHISAFHKNVYSIVVSAPPREVYLLSLDPINFLSPSSQSHEPTVKLLNPDQCNSVLLLLDHEVNADFHVCFLQ